MPAKPCPEVLPTHFLNTSRDDDFTASLVSLVQRLTTLLVKRFFLKSNLTPSQHNLRPFPLIATYLEEVTTHLTTTCFWLAVGSDQVSPQPPLLQTKQSQFPQPLFVRLVIWICPPRYLFPGWVQRELQGESCCLGDGWQDECSAQHHGFPGTCSNSKGQSFSAYPINLCLRAAEERYE